VVLKDLTQVVFTLPSEAADALAAHLTDDVSGVEVRDSETNSELTGDVMQVVIWLPSSEVERRVAQTERLLESLEQTGMRIQPWTWGTKQVDPAAWEDAYKKFFKTTKVGRHLVVKPSWESHRPEPGDLVLELDPGMAFGTGQHASTRLVIHAMERLAHQGFVPKTMLDLGCGTGILAMAGARLWPNAKILAVDNDEVAVQVCRENLARNDLETRVIVDHGSAASVSGAYGLVLANLTSEILTDLQPKMRRLMERHGYLCVSGITADQASEIARLYCQSLEMEPEYSEEIDGWRAILLRARG
jgi:ribosomal protein L11 methyltransferase